VTLKVRLVNGVITFITAILCRIDRTNLDQMPSQGPLILICNHINFLEVPVIMPRLMPRPVTGFVKLQTFDNPFFSFLFNTWGTIPIRRGEADLEAFQKGIQALQAGKIMAISPEGTRSNNGVLKIGYPGVVLLAVRSGAPILPLVHYGGEMFWPNFKRLKRTNFKILIGNPFTIQTGGQALSREVRQKITSEVMYQLAALLPPEYRGLYSDLSKATEEYIRFAPEVESNLRRAVIKNI
jgi:1-acyl-sn-glycerol-3-phosphate acyltransferase